MTKISKEYRQSSLEIAQNLLEIKAYSKWMRRNILPNKTKIEEATGEPVLIEEVRNPNGKPTIIAWFTKRQVIHLVSMTQKNHKNGSVKMKELLCKLVEDLKNENTVLKTHILQTKWSKLKNQIVLNTETNPEAENKLNGFFSPDIKFAEFLESIEGQLGYSLKWDFHPQGCSASLFKVTPAEAEALKTYRFITEELHYNDDGSEHDHFLTMWGWDDQLPFLEPFDVDENIEPDKYTAGVAWITQPRNVQEAWRQYIEQALYVVKVYNSPELRAKYGIASHEEQASGWWDGPQENSKPLADMLLAEKRFNQVVADNSSCVNASGFQIHLDWVEWLREDSSKARNAREFFLGSSDPVEFIDKEVPMTWEDSLNEHWLSPRTKLIKDLRTKYVSYKDCDFYENYEQWEEESQAHWEKTFEELERPPLSKDRPLFSNVRLYSNDLLPIFEMYLTHVWLPQHSVKFFQVTDPEGFPQLCQAMRSLPPSHNLPRQFVEAMQPLLSAAQ